MRNNHSLILKLALVITCLNLSVLCKEPDWYLSLRQLTPLKSTKADVNKVFRNPVVRRAFIEDESEIVLYDTKEGKLSVAYSVGKCSTLTGAGFRVEKDVVLKVTYFPQGHVKFTDLRVDKSQFVKTSGGHDPGWRYVSYTLGLEFAVQRHRVDYAELFPAESENNTKCP